MHVAEIYGAHFEYNGIQSRRYGLMIANIETERFNQTYGTRQGITLFNKSSLKRYLIDDDYSDSPITIDIEIVTDNQKIINPHERRTIERWLFGQTKYQKFYIDMADDSTGESFEYKNGEYKRLYLNCRFVNPTKIEYNGGIVGYKTTLEADSGMWYQDRTVQTFTLNHESSSSHSTIDVVVDTDLKRFTYPKVTLTTGDVGGNVTILNHADDIERTTQFSQLAANTSVILNGETNYISGQNFEKFYKQNFPRLLDGTNHIYIAGNIKTIKFEFYNRRFW
jgi:phage-related protein